MAPDWQCILEGVRKEPPEGGFHKLQGSERGNLLMPRLLSRRSHSLKHILQLQIHLQRNAANMKKPCNEIS